MATFTFTIRTDNAAFADGDERYELARILRKYAERIESDGVDHHTVSVMDVNGNRVGGYVLREDDDQ